MTSEKLRNTRVTHLEDAKRKAFVERAENLAGSLQMEVYTHAHTAFVARHGDARAGKIAAGIANFVCRFGYVNPLHQADKQLLSLCESERPAILRAFGDTFKTSATGALILLGAAWTVDLAKFNAHISLLAQEGFAKIGRNAPNVRCDLPETDLIYMYEVGSMPNPAGEDRLMLNLILDTPKGKKELGRVTQMLDEDVQRSRFNRERAQEVFLFAIDNCVHRYFKSIGVNAAIVFPKGIRRPFANELADNYIQARGNLESQRPARRGLLSYIVGK